MTKGELVSFKLLWIETAVAALERLWHHGFWDGFQYFATFSHPLLCFHPHGDIRKYIGTTRPDELQRGHHDSWNFR